MKQHIKTGDRVRIKIDPAEQTALKLYKLNGKVAEVDSCRLIARGGGFIYTLGGCVTDKGIPYSFVEDWLERVED